MFGSQVQSEDTELDYGGRVQLGKNPRGGG